MTAPRTVAVIGGTGMLGMPVVRRLVADGFSVRLVARNPQAARAKLGLEVDAVPGDVEDPASIEAALEGCDAVHVSLMGGPSPEDHDRIEHRGTRTVAEIAARLGLQRLTYLSGAPAREENFRDSGSKAKFMAERAIRDSGVSYTIFQVTWMMESLPLFVRGNKAIVVGKQAHPLRWIACDDYARMVSQALRDPATADKTYFVVGPEARSKPEALQLYIERVRPDVKLRVMPVWLMRVVAALSFDNQLRADVRRLAFYDTIGDDFGDPTEANATFGPATTTLVEWCEQQTAR